MRSSTAREREKQQAAQREAQMEEEARAARSAARKQMLEDLAMSIGAVVDAAANGAFSQWLERTFDEPELDAMARGIDRLQVSVEAGAGETSHVLTRMAAGGFDNWMTGTFSGAFSDLQSNVNEAIIALSDLIVEITTSGDADFGQSGHLNEAAESLARRTQCDFARRNNGSDA